MQNTPPTTNSQPPILTENTKNLILGGDWGLAKTLSANNPKRFLHAFSLAIAHWLCPIIKQMWANIRSPQRHTLELTKFKSELVLLGKMRICLAVYKIEGNEYCEVSLPCQINGLNYDEYTLTIPNYSDNIQDEFIVLFMQQRKNEDQSMAARWLKEFKKYLPK